MQIYREKKRMRERERDRYTQQLSRVRWEIEGKRSREGTRLLLVALRDACG